MLPPLKSLILKWGLLAQWLYWAKYLQAILACPAILLPGHGHIFLFFYCPDTDSLCCQHPSCLFTDVDCCITISIHLISTRAAIDSFGKSVQDNGYGMFREMLDYKLAWKGKKMVKVDRFFPSSKKCCKCGRIKKELKLSERVYRCACGNEMDRDRNAAINIREEARRMLTA